VRAYGSPLALYAGERFRRVTSHQLLSMQGEILSLVFIDVGEIAPRDYAPSMTLRNTASQLAILMAKSDKSPVFAALWRQFSLATLAVHRAYVNYALDWLGTCTQILTRGRNRGVPQGSRHEVNRRTRSRLCVAWA
jgi:hypothetical protein